MNYDADPFFQPISAMELARFTGVPTFMRLPCVNPDHDCRSRTIYQLWKAPYSCG